MAFTITDLGTPPYETWTWSSLSGNLFIGAHFLGATSAEEGVILSFTFNFSGTLTGIYFLNTTGGSFTPGETCNVQNGSGAGSFTIGTQSASASTNTIQVTGTSATASGSLTAEAVDISETTIDVDDDTDFIRGDVILIDSEYMYVYYSQNGTPDTIEVERGFWGSTPATHADNTTIYIVDRDLFQQCYDASVSGVWGYDSLSDGRLKLNCNIVIGDSNESSAQTIVFSSKEAIEVPYDIPIVGSNSYQTYAYFGEGQRGVRHSYRQGSIIVAKGVGHTQENGVLSCRYGHLEAYACTFEGLMTVDDAYIGRCDFGSTDRTYISPQCMGLQIGTECDGITYYDDILISGGPFNPASARADFDRILIGNNINGLYFLASGGSNPLIWYCDLYDSENDQIFAFAEGGNKEFYNSTVDFNSIGRYLSGATFENYKTVDMTIKNAAGTAIPNVQVRAWNTTQNPLVDTPIFNVTTNASGQIAQQNVLIEDKWIVGSTPRDFRPITFWITKVGWKEIVITDPLATEIALNLTMETIEKEPMTG